MSGIFEAKAEKVDKTDASWVGPDQCPDEVRYPVKGILVGSRNDNNSVRHVDRPRRGYDYSY